MNKNLNAMQELLPMNINKVETHSRTVNSYFTTIGEEGVGSAEDHYDQIETLKHANPGDTYIMTISSGPGGSFSGLLAFKNALESTDANTICILEGDLASACTILPFYFDTIHVTPYTTFMVHSANFGVPRNTASNVERNAAFQAKQIERFLREAYKNFLSESEVLRVLDGAEMYLDEFDIQKRLEVRAEILSEECDCGECDVDDISFPEIVPPAPPVEVVAPKKPVRKTTKKK